MQKTIISNKQGICIISMFIIGSAIVVGLGTGAKQDVWISILIALLMSLPMVFIYAQLLSVYPGKDLYDILMEVFGPIAGRAVSLLYLWYSFHLGALVIRNFSEFVNVMSFPETPQFIVIIFLGLISVWMVKAGIEVLGRFSAFVFPTILGIIIIALILSTANIHLINIRPILYDGIKPVLTNAFSFFSFPLAETVIFTMVFHNLKDAKKSVSVFLLGCTIGCGVLLLTSVRNILVLGVPTATSLYFPSYVAVRTINIGGFLQRFEASVAIIFMTTGFIKISVCLYSACNGFAKIFNIRNYKQLVAPIGFLMMNLACLIYTNTMDMFSWAQKIYPYYALPFQVIMPIIIYAAAKIKFRVKTPASVAKS